MVFRSWLRRSSRRVAYALGSFYADPCKDLLVKTGLGAAETANLDLLFSSLRLRLQFPSERECLLPFAKMSCYGPQSNRKDTSSDCRRSGVLCFIGLLARRFRSCSLSIPLSRPGVRCRRAS